MKGKTKKIVKDILLSVVFISSISLSGNILAKEVASCTAKLTCQGGGVVSCTGHHECRVYSYYVECDQEVYAYCD